MGEFCPLGASEAVACPAGSYCPTPAEIEDCNNGEYCPESVIASRSCRATTRSMRLCQTWPSQSCPVHRDIIAPAGRRKNARLWEHTARNSRRSQWPVLRVRIAAHLPRKLPAMPVNTAWSQAPKSHDRVQRGTIARRRRAKRNATVELSVQREVCFQRVFAWATTR